MGGKILIVLSIIVVALILFAGLYTMWAGGKVSRDWGNRLMRYRILAQFVAILVILLVLYFCGAH